MNRILYIADSRGFALRQQVGGLSLLNYNIDLTILPKAGVTITQAVDHAFRHVGNQTFDVIYLAAGVNDLSEKHGYRDISPIYSNRYEIVYNLMQKYYRARILLDMLGHRVVICELVGLNYQQYNLRNAPFPMEQEEVNAAIIMVNKYVRYINTERLLYSPNTTEYTHKQRETNNLIHRYRLTTYDGIHMRWEYSVKIMDRVIINILQILGQW